MVVKIKLSFYVKLNFHGQTVFLRIIKHVTKMNLLFNLNLGLPTDKPNMAMFMVSVNFYVIHYIIKFSNFQHRVANVQLNIIRRLVEIMIISYHIIYFFSQDLVVEKKREMRELEALIKLTLTFVSRFPIGTFTE